MTTNWIPERSVEEQIAHSEQLNADEGKSYGKGPIVAYEVSLSFKDNDKGNAWQEGTDFFRQLEGDGWDGHSAGTGFGERDMQFGRTEPMSKTDFDKLVQDAKANKINLVYITQYGVNEWGEAVDEETEHNYHYNPEESQATDKEIREAVEAYKEGVLEEGPKKYRVWVDSDAPQVQMALAMRDKGATLVQINEVANQMGLT